jgi:hypothetical protein
MAIVSHIVIMLIAVWRSKEARNLDKVAFAHPFNG